MKISWIAGLGVLLLGAAAASADDAKVYIGSQCGFQNAVLTSSSKSGHSLVNNTGIASRWSTCPLIKERVGGGEEIEHASITVSGSVSRCRLEMRRPNGGLVGWNHYNVVNLGGGRNRFEWFGGSSRGNYDADSGLAIECLMNQGARIESYKLTEDS